MTGGILVAGQSTVPSVVTTFGDSSARIGAPALHLSAAGPALFSANGSGSRQGAVITLDGQPAGPAARGQYVAIYQLPF